MERNILSPIILESEYVKQFEYFPPDEIPSKEKTQAEFSIETDTRVDSSDPEDAFRLVGTVSATVSKDGKKVLAVSVQGKTATIKKAISDDVDLKRVAEFNTIALLYSYLRVIVESTTRSFGRPISVPTLSIDAVLENERKQESKECD